MAEVIRMPLLSDTMTEGKIVAWNKKVGDKVKADDVLADVETDKATMEVNGYVDGTLLYIGIEAGKAAKVNEIIAIYFHSSFICFHICKHIISFYFIAHFFIP